MKDAPRKPARSIDDPVPRASSQGQGGMAVSPPSYGVNFVDRLSSRTNRTGLPDKLKTGVELLSGFSMDDVRVHFNSAQPARLGALAYTHATDIYLGPGQESHLPHEAWHVVQQKQGRARPIGPTWRGAWINNQRSLEREADVMGMRAYRDANRVDVHDDPSQPGLERLGAHEEALSSMTDSQSTANGPSSCSVIQMREIQLPDGTKLVTERYSSLHLIVYLLKFLAQGERQVVSEIMKALAAGEHSDEVPVFSGSRSFLAGSAQIPSFGPQSLADPRSISRIVTNTPRPQGIVSSKQIERETQTLEPNPPPTSTPVPEPKEAPRPSEQRGNILKLIASSSISGLLAYQAALINSFLQEEGATRSRDPSVKRAHHSLMKFNTIGFHKNPSRQGVYTDLFNPKSLLKHGRSALRAPWQIFAASIALSGANLLLNKTIKPPKIKDILQEELNKTKR